MIVLAAGVDEERRIGARDRWIAVGSSGRQAVGSALIVT